MKALTIGQLAIKEGNRAEALRVVQEAQNYLPQVKGLEQEFTILEAEAKK